MLDLKREMVGKTKLSASLSFPVCNVENKDALLIFVVWCCSILASHKTCQALKKCW